MALGKQITGSGSSSGAQSESDSLSFSFIDEVKESGF